LLPTALCKCHTAALTPFSGFDAVTLEQLSRTILRPPTTTTTTTHTHVATLPQSVPPCETPSPASAASASAAVSRQAAYEASTGPDASPIQQRLAQELFDKGFTDFRSGSAASRQQYMHPRNHHQHASSHDRCGPRYVLHGPWLPYAKLCNACACVSEYVLSTCKQAVSKRQGARQRD